MTPKIEMQAPSISLGFTFSLNIQMDTGMMSIGEMEVMDETMPVAVCCKASNDKLTPINGPNTDPTTICPMALLLLNDVMI